MILEGVSNRKEGVTMEKHQVIVSVVHNNYKSETFKVDFINHEEADKFGDSKAKELISLLNNKKILDYRVSVVRKGR